MKYILFNGGYSRVGVHIPCKGTCSGCGQEKVGVSSDSSEGEYASSFICLDCAEQLVLSFSEDSVTLVDNDLAGIVIGRVHKKLQCKCSFRGGNNENIGRLIKNPECIYHGRLALNKRQLDDLEQSLVKPGIRIYDKRNR